MSRRQSRPILATATLLCLTLAGFFLFRPHSAEPLDQATTALAQGDTRKAKEIATQILATDPHHIEALIIAGQAVFQEGEFLRARNDPAGNDRLRDTLRYYSQIPLTKRPESIEAHFQCGLAALLLFDATAAEAHFRAVLEVAPQHPGANTQLLFLLRISGRNWELRPHLHALLKQGQPVDINSLLAAASTIVATTAEDARFIERCLQADAGSFGVWLGAARECLYYNKREEAQQYLEDLILSQPDLLEAQARLGFLLLDATSHGDFTNWHQQLPAAAEQHPEIWHVRGLWQHEHGTLSGAARCFGEALLRDPYHWSANYQMSQVLIELQRPQDAAPFLHRSQQLAKLKRLVNASPNVPSNLRLVVESMESLGRHWEAIGWCDLIARQPHSDAQWARDTAKRLHAEQSPDALLFREDANLASQITRSDFPLPTPIVGESRSASESKLGSNNIPVSFFDAAAAADLSFSYFNGANPLIDRAYMFEFSGGGVGILDFDSDGWNDIYLTQGCRWPLDSEQQEFRNRLFRNLGNGSFADVTEPVQVGDNGYGQGVAVGDFDNDGFPDLYVANIGPNRLYRNNGDGTFADISSDVGIEKNTWTVSCLMADLNGDSYPDLFDVNYLTGDDVFTQRCTLEGQPIQCYPSDFPAAQDRVFVSDGTGHFQDQTVSAGIVIPEGKGMGVVAADFDDSQRLSLMITNDTTANFFFLNQTDGHTQQLSFSEEALIRGVALSQHGMADSCMGIAVGDANGDALLDLFVTNFRDEANNFFVQQDLVNFDDQIAQAQLRDAGFPMEGWGTQFVDGDLDGLPDLFVANGDLGDYFSTDPHEKMPAQFFRNLGNARFQELSEHTLGPYFAKRRLGRAVARIDWNRDGCADLCVTHVDSPTALLTNRGDAVGHSISVRLRGVNCSRDAIGSTVTVTTANQSQTHQLVAGDGFSASNERQLIFGLGAQETIDLLTVKWASGLIQSFVDVAVDREVLLIEGNPELYPLPRASQLE